ncbi:MAG TPA: hypothetical protein VGE39_25685 [Prosthecobacter sp.]
MFKIISNKPWLLAGGGFLFFVTCWVSFLVFAVRHQPPGYKRGEVVPAATMAASAAHRQNAQKQTQTQPNGTD